RGNMNHLCLVIEKADFERVMDHLKKNGAEMHLGPVPRWGARGMGTSIYFHDPEGNMVEIRQY
ncbi:MAG: VOC family protein, partial [Nitrospinota bacterium]